MKFFLNAKGWQLFLVLFAPMLGAPMIDSVVPNPVAAMAASSLIFMAVYFGWMWAIAAAANQKLDPPLRRSTTWMAIGLVYAAAYLVGALLLLPGVSEPGDGMPTFFVPMHLAAMFAVFYAFAFTARRLVTLERKQQVSFFDYSGPLVLFWFFPIGVWFIQPKVNKLLGNHVA